MGGEEADSAAGGAAPLLLDPSGTILLRDPVFISDLHLCAQRPRTLARALALFEDTAAQHAELVILGDLFEYWPGDDSLDASTPDDDLARTVVAALRRLTDRGLAVLVMHGNRDVLLGPRFTAASGTRLLPDPAIALIGGVATLLSHGDAYCTRDTAYQRFRLQARDPRFQAAFLARPLAERRALIGQARAQSEQEKQRLAAEIMDVTPEAIVQALQDTGAVQMIHGHTHLPGRHDFSVDGREVVRWVLPDWDDDAEPARGGSLRLVGGDPTLRTLR